MKASRLAIRHGGSGPMNYLLARLAGGRMPMVRSSTSSEKAYAEAPRR